MNLLLKFNDEIRRIVGILTDDPSSDVDVSEMKNQIIAFIENPSEDAPIEDKATEEENSAATEDPLES